MNRVQVESFVIKLFNGLQDWKTFKDTLRDLLISMKSFASQNDDLYAEEKQVSSMKPQPYTMCPLTVSLCPGTLDCE